MNRRQAARHPRSTPRSRAAGRGGTLLGIFIGLVLGLAIAAAVAYFLGRSGLTTPMTPAGGAKEPARGARPELGAVSPPPTEKPRFDFYKILPGGEESKAGADRRAVDKIGERPADKTQDASRTAEPAAKASDRFWLQAGAFASPAEAEDMKARLALSGWEAAIQPVAMPDKSQRYRVRLGPYDNTDELNRMKKELGNRGFDVAVVKNP
ncbi:MAG TPA: SPOR domain-containing protein [Casimicrobiaceae bacterium]|nr:SPOR domain-containing protein [Casimicrobiaceae bacterium]